MTQPEPVGLSVCWSQHRMDPSRGLKSGVGGPSTVLAAGSEDRT